MISFEPFWKHMEEKNITTYGLEYEYNFNPAEIRRLKINHNFTMKTLNRICEKFHFEIEDIICYLPDDVEGK